MTITDQVFAHAKVKGLELLLLLALARRADDNAEDGGWFYKDIETIRRETRMDQLRFERLFKSLERKRFIARSLPDSKLVFGHEVVPYRFTPVSEWPKSFEEKSN